MSSGYERTRVPNQTLPIEWTVDIATHLNGPWSVVGEVSGTYKIEEDQDLGTLNWLEAPTHRLVAVRSTTRCDV
jgi:hypothetical protein